ncbi:hypothetical protein GWI33_021699 [Rhynchophorus ferrugineus]|uniref:SCP domain-containing protein n=1 Tax=Rhynchophorus ferrugineus TaxID=354439 RepID=A0A834MJG4_RHYFE|nr:hypothetical protein GWI33_021699 [Rhynchophorus ferrugineus]
MKFSFPLLLFAVIQNSLSFDWCTMNCQQAKHIACERMGQCDSLGACSFVTLDPDELLEHHNHYRSMFANGEEPQSGGLKVSNMMALVWNEELAFTASCNLAACEGMKHDQCRGVPDYPAAGQNLWSTSFSGGGDCKSKAASAVKLWYDEIKLITSADIKKKGTGWSSDGVSGHFTQVVWAQTEAVGCALTELKKSGMTDCTLACNYGPSGNVLGGSMFIEGPPCSNCPENVKCGKVKDGLCGSAIRSYSKPSLCFISIIFVLLVQVIK